MPRMYVKEYPWYSPWDTARRVNGILAARLMLNAALTAPTTGGEDHTEGEIVWGDDEQEKLARKMEELSYSLKNKRIADLLKTEAVMARAADCILFIGDYRARISPFDIDCGICGGKEGCSYVYKRHRTSAGLIDPTDRDQGTTPVQGPLCLVRVNDMGYNIGSGLWMANRLMVDCKPSFWMGVAGQKLGYCKNSPLVVALPVATLAKNAFVDVNYDYHVTNMDRILDEVRKIYILPRQMGTDFRKYRVVKEDETPSSEGEEE